MQLRDRQQRGLTLALWFTLLATMPLPYFMVEIGWMPALWLMSLAILVSASALFDGFAGTWLIALLFIAQAATAVGLLYFIAALIQRALSRLGRAAIYFTTCALVIAAFWIASTAPIFWTDLVNVDPRTSLLNLF
jgi:hypothetical protein